MSTTGPLGDATNTSGSQPAAPTIEEFELIRAELKTMKAIVTGFSKKTRKRKRKTTTANHSDTENDTGPSSNRAKTTPPELDQDFSCHGRIVARLLGPFVAIEDIITHGLTVDTAILGDEEDGTVDEQRLYDGWKILYQKFPGFHELMLKNHKNLELIQSIARQMNLGIEGARSDDTGTLKPRILSLLDEKPAPDAKIVMTTGSSKATRATDPAVAALLLPLEYKYDPAHPDPWASIAAGDLDLNSRQLPCFLFPFGQANDDSALDTILHGPVMLRCGKAVYMGPSSALQGDGFHQGRAGIASIIGLRSFTDRVIAGLACQVRFNLSSMQAWNRHDGNFDYEEFFWCIVDLFKNPEFAANTIALYNRVILGHAAGLAPATHAVAAGPAPALTHLERLQAARAAREAAASGGAPASG